MSSLHARSGQLCSACCTVGLSWRWRVAAAAWAPPCWGEPRAARAGKGGKRAGQGRAGRLEAGCAEPAADPQQHHCPTLQRVGCRAGLPNRLCHFGCALRISPHNFPLSLCRPAEQCSAHKLRKGRWQPAVLRVSAHAVERLDPGSGLVKWRLEYRHMASPAGIAGGTAACGTAAATAAHTAWHHNRLPAWLSTFSLMFPPSATMRPLSRCCSPAAGARRGAARGAGRLCAVWQDRALSSSVLLPGAGRPA